MDSFIYLSRIARHDNIVDPMISGLTRLGYEVCREPAIFTPGGTKRSDLVLVKNDLTIPDVAIAADNADLEKEHNASITINQPFESGPNDTISLV